MRLRIILLIVAIIIGVVAVVAVVSYISSIRTSVEKEVEKVEVLVADSNIPKEIPVEVIISSETVVLKAIPQKYLANGVLTSLEDFKGFVTSAPINKGEQITTTKFVKPEQIGLSFTIPADMVAVSIPINEVIGVSYMLNVGDLVNVIATFSPAQQKEESERQAAGKEEVLDQEVSEIDEEGLEGFVLDREITRTLLWNVEILHIGIRMEAPGMETMPGEDEDQSVDEGVDYPEIRTVTLALTPEQAEKIVFSEEYGSVWLALAPVDGIERTDTSGRTYDNIFEE